MCLKNKIACWFGAIFVSISIGALAQNYTYDDLGRVKTVSYSSTATRYNYDNADNRTSTVTTANTPPTCTNPTYTVTGIPSYATATITITASAIIALCTDPNGDTLTVTIPTPLPYSFSISAGQTVKIPYTVFDGQSGTGSGVITYTRP